MNNLIIPKITRLLYHDKVQTFYQRLVSSKMLNSACRNEDQIRIQTMNIIGLLVQ